MKNDDYGDDDNTLFSQIPTKYVLTFMRLGL